MQLKLLYNRPIQYKDGHALLALEQSQVIVSRLRLLHTSAVPVSC